MRIERLIRDEDGFTTAGMAIALLVSLSLMFSAVQVYRINTLSAEVQDVADAAALAAENQVAEFMIAVRVVDSAVLSMTLLGITSYGLGVVALCVPPTAEVGAKLISAGEKILDARNSFADRAAQSLNELQRALSFMAAASAAAVAEANGQGGAGSYHAMALLLPAEGKTIAVGGNDAEGSLAESVASEKDALAEAAERAEEAMKRAQEAKERAFRRDCGDNPSYCMYERASHLAGLAGSDNPLYHSVDTWSFTAARDRALAYYRSRLLGEGPANDSSEEKARSALRKDFYAYAIDQLRATDLKETATSLEGSFPRFPHNLEELRSTSLYTTAKYPVDTEEELPVMHAWEGCPGLGLVDYYDSVHAWEAGEYAVCEQCKFTASSLASVAAASTSIDNGFEYHYDAVARAAEEYQTALREAAPLAESVKSGAQGLFDKVVDALRGTVSMRIDAVPPGAVGCIALAIAPGGDAMPDAPFVSASSKLGSRVAVSAAVLLEDETDEASVIGNLLDGLSGLGAPAGAAGVLLDCWDAMLKVYGSGQEALIEGVGNALDALPLVGASGLGPWAAGALQDALDAVGLEPADVKPLKSVLAHTAAVASADGGEYAVRFLSVRDQVLSSSLGQGNPLASLADSVEREAYERLADLEIEIACIELPFGMGSLPLTVTLPPSVRQGAQGLVDQAVEALRSAVASWGFMRPWE